MPAALPPTTVFGARLRQARLALDLRQRDVGLKLGLDEAAATRVSRYETGRHDPDPETAQAIAKALKLPLAYFYAEDAATAEAIRVLAKLTKAQREEVVVKLRGWAAK